MRFRSRTRTSIEPALIDCEVLCFGDNQRPFNHILQFSNVSRPGIGLQSIQSCFRYSADRFSRFPCQPMYEVFNQHGDIFLAFAQRRNLDRKHIKAIEEIAAKCAGSNSVLQVTVGGGDHSHISLTERIPTKSLKFPTM